MNFLEIIFGRLREAARSPVLREARDGQLSAATGSELLEMIAAARAFLRGRGMKKGDRCALLAPNSIRWAALDLAIMAERGIVVPLYSRQAPAELVAMMKDCSPAMVCCADEALDSSITEIWPGAPPSLLFDDIFSHDANIDSAVAPQPLAGGDAVTIMYTSGTSGESKGVILTAGNVNFMLERTSARLDLLMGATGAPERVFHYLPFCFTASWIALLSFLSRNSIVTISTDLTKLAQEMKLAQPDYFLNVPALLEKMKTGIEGQFKQWGGPRQTVFEKGRESWHRRRAGMSSFMDSFWLAVTSTIIFPSIRKQISPNLKGLICGSAPLALETQLFFAMLGVPV